MIDRNLIGAAAENSFFLFRYFPQISLQRSAAALLRRVNIVKRASFHLITLNKHAFKLAARLYRSPLFFQKRLSDCFIGSLLIAAITALSCQFSVVSIVRRFSSP